MVEYTVKHTTIYEYSQLTTLSYNTAYLLPRSFDLPTFRQDVMDAVVTVKPTVSDMDTYTDFFGNNVTYFALRSAHSKMDITAESLSLIHI